MLRATSVSNAVDLILWFIFLALLASASFVASVYPAGNWLLLQTAFALLLLIKLLQMLVSPKKEVLILQKAKLAIILLLLSLSWLCLQVWLPLDNPAIRFLFEESGSLANYQPVWWSNDHKWSLVPQQTAILLQQEVFMFVVFLSALLLLNTRQRIFAFIYLMLAMSVVHAALGIFAQQANIFFVPLAELDGHFNAARGLFVNRNHYAAFIGLSSAACIFFFLRSFRQATTDSFWPAIIASLTSWRLPLFFVSVLLLAALALSQSRAGFLGLLLSTFVTVAFFGQGLFKRRYVLPVFTVVVVASLIFFGSDLISRFSTDAVLGERWSQWKITWQIILKNPLLGYGGNSYADVFQLFRELSPMRYVVFNQAHNEFLHIWLEQGLIGLLLWTGFLAAVAMRLVRSIRRLKSVAGRCLCIALFAVLLATTLQSIVDFHLHIVTIRIYCFSFCALAFATPLMQQKQTQRKRIKQQ